MKKQKKRIFGFIGLFLVIATTIFAMFLPGPGASAINNVSVTDTIVVQVVNNGPLINITSDQDDEKLITQNQVFNFEYFNTERIDLTLRYTDDNGITTEYSLTGSDGYIVEDDDGTYTENLDLSSIGYGEYVLVAEATGRDGVKDIKSIAFSFIPVWGEIVMDDENGPIYLDLHYDTDNENIDKIKIDIYDENGNLIEKISPIEVSSPITSVELPFSKNNLPAGDYIIKIYALNSNGDVLYDIPYIENVSYKRIIVPDTGILFVGLNISKTDYLITGLLVFLSVAFIGFAIVAKRNKINRLTARRKSH